MVAIDSSSPWMDQTTLPASQHTRSAFSLCPLRFLLQNRYVFWSRIVLSPTDDQVIDPDGCIPLSFRHLWYEYLGADDDTFNPLEDDVQNRHERTFLRPDRRIKRHYDAYAPSALDPQRTAMAIAAREPQTSKITIPVVVVAVIVINLLVLFLWYRRSAFREYFRSGKASSFLWSLLCCTHRPERVRPRTRISPWSIDDTESGFGFDTHRNHNLFDFSNSTLGSYSRLTDPASRTSHSSAKVLWWKVWDGLQRLNPFKRNPVVVKSTNRRRSRFLIVENSRPSPQSTGHLPSATSVSSDDPLYLSDRSAGYSASSTSSFPSSSSRKTPWGSWKNPFKSNLPSVASSYPNTGTRMDDSSHGEGLAANTRVSSENIGETSRGYPSTETTDSGRGRDLSNPRVRQDDPQREESVILISRWPGVDFSINSCSAQSSMDDVIVVVPPSDAASFSTRNEVHTHATSHPSLSPTTSLSDSELCSSPSPTRMSLEDPTQHLLHDKESSAQSYTIDSPTTEHPAHLDSDHPLPQNNPYRMLRPSRSDPVLLFPGAVRAAGYTGVMDRYYNHNRCNSSTTDLPK